MDFYLSFNYYIYSNTLSPFTYDFTVTTIYYTSYITFSLSNKL